MEGQRVLSILGVSAGKHFGPVLLEADLCFWGVLFACALCVLRLVVSSAGACVLPELWACSFYGLVAVASVTLMKRQSPGCNTRLSASPRDQTRDLMSSGAKHEGDLTRFRYQHNTYGKADPGIYRWLIEGTHTASGHRTCSLHCLSSSEKDVLKWVVPIGNRSVAILSAGLVSLGLDWFQYLVDAACSLLVQVEAFFSFNGAASLDNV
eukprot:226629-Pelagomonas_calceolata.AAC.1